MAYSISRLENGILLFTIEREEKRNAINFEVMDGLRKLIDAAGEKEVKGAIITGAGSMSFCSGGDLFEFHLLRTKEEALPMLSKMAGILHSLLTLPKPVIAVLNGTAVGGGCELAAACDFRIAKRGSKAGFIQGRQGIITGWGGGSILAEKLPSSIAMRLMMEASPLPAEELLDMGFLDGLYEGDPVEAGMQYLSRMAELESDVLMAFKGVMADKWQHAGIASRMEKEAEACAELWQSEAHHKQVAKFLAKR